MVTRYDWAVSLLKWMGAPNRKRNRRALIAWQSAEGTTAKWNPLATTQKEPGSTDFNTTGVQNYLIEEDGLNATLDTLHDHGHGYELIMKRLMNNARPRATLEAVRDSDWGTGALALKILPDVSDDPNGTYGSKPIGQ